MNRPGRVTGECIRSVLVISSMFLMLGCQEDQVTEVPKGISAVIHPIPGGCVPPVTMSYTDLTQSVFTTFEVPDTLCSPDLYQYGIEMTDPTRTESPQGDGWFGVTSTWSTANMPSPQHLAYGGYYTPSQVIIEFDPKVRSIEFYYSRLLNDPSSWGDGHGRSDSMKVYALTDSRSPVWSKTLYSNVSRTTPPYDRWDLVKIDVGSDVIRYLQFNGLIVMDNFKVTHARDPNAPCPPTGDSILNDSTVRQQFLQQLARSRPSASGTDKKEFGGYIYKKDDGTYFLQPANDLTATDCGFSIPAGSPPDIPGAHYTNAFWHTHPSSNGERLYGCRNAKPTDIVKADRNPKHGGGSPQDWDAVDNAFTPGYIINLDKEVFRLDPGTSRALRGSNPNHWKFDSANRCLFLAS